MKGKAALAFAIVVIGVASCAGGLSHAPTRRAPSSERGPEVRVATTASGLKLPVVEPPYDDPRLAGVRARERAHDFEAAALIVSQARKVHANDPHAGCAWAYLEGRLATAANQFAAAVAAFDAVVAADDAAGTGRPPCGLASYARLRAAQAAGKLAQWDGVVDRLRPVPEDFVLAGERVVAEAEALYAKGDRVGAAALWRKMIAKDPFGPRWVDSSAKLATAILDGTLGDPKAGAREAYDLATRILVSAPKFADLQGAPGLRTKAAGLLHDAGAPDALTLEERAKQVQAWLDGSEPTRAVTEANAAWASAGKSPPCKLAIVRAQAVGRTKQPADGVWGEAITACEGQPEQATAFFGGGKASSGKKPDEAKERFQKLEERFPKNRLADDARLLSAMIIRDAGDEDRFAKMLLALPDDYPEGDMRSEGLFRVALERMKKSDYKGAIAPLERILALGSPARSPQIARAAYFLGRAAEESGEAERARERYVHVLEEFPLSYPMLLAYQRLAAKDEAFARRALDEATAHGREIARPTPPSLDPEGIARAVRLLEVGEVEPARKEVSKAGLNEGGEHAVAIGQLFARAGAFDVGVALARKTDLLSHYPNDRWREAWEGAYPRAHEDLVRAESTKNGIPVSLAWGIMREESAFVVEAKSPANAFGLMQLIVPTAKLVAQGTGMPWDEVGLKRADVNVTLGTRLLGQLRGSLGDARVLAPAAYNAGAGALGRWRAARKGEPFDLFVEEIPYEETRNYVKKVLSSQATYAFLYERPELGEVLALPLQAP
jgi:soluble lytic murein transglycosylase